MRYSLKSIVIKAVTLTVLAGTALAQQASGNADLLKTLTTCKWNGDLQVVEVGAKKPGAEPHREVITAKGKEKVSVTDGYRVMFAYKDVTYYFANVKIEKSDPASYERDKGIVIDHLKHFAASEQATKMIFADKSALNGFEHYGLFRDKIDVGGQIGQSELFYDKEHLIITIYFLNQQKKKRRFNSIEEFHQVKDDFLSRYSACLSGHLSGGGNK